MPTWNRLDQPCTLSAEMPAELHDHFVRRARQLGLARGKVLRILVEVFVEGADVALDGEVFRRARREKEARG